MQYGGAWTARTSEKIMRFVDLAQTFHLPVVHLVDCPGFLIGPQAEAEGTIRYGMRAAAAILQSSVPWCSVIVRKVFGVAGALHQNSSRYGMRMPGLSAEWGSLRSQAAGSRLPLRNRSRARSGRETRRNRAAHPQVRLADARCRALRHRGDHRPRNTRALLCEFAELAAPAHAGTQCLRSSSVEKYRPSDQVRTW